MIAKYDQLKVSEWFTIQNEISALAQIQSEMKRIKRVQKVMERKIKNKTELYDDIAMKEGINVTEGL